MAPSTASLSRCLAVWAATTAVAAGCTGPLLHAAAALEAHDVGTRRFDEVLVWACAATALVAAGWLWLVGTAVVVEALTGAESRVPGVPAGVRRLLLTACGVALAGGVVAGVPSSALATPGDLHEDHAGAPALLAGLPYPDRATSTADAPPHRADGEDAVVVRPGDSLWELARLDLGPRADAAAVAARWHRIYALNRNEVGPDPDLIVPGQRLEMPPEVAR